MVRLALIEKVMLQARSAAVRPLSSLYGKGSVSPHFLTLGSTSMQAVTLSVIHLPESRNPARRYSVVLVTACHQEFLGVLHLDRVLVDFTSRQHRT